MKKKPNKVASEVEMRSEYDFSGGIRGKYAERCARGTNIVLLDPDVAQLFPTAKAVNEALRAAAKRGWAKKAGKPVAQR